MDQQVVALQATAAPNNMTRRNNGCAESPARGHAPDNQNALEDVGTHDGDSQAGSYSCIQLVWRFFQTLSVSMSPALAIALASTEETSRKPCELTGFRPSEASMEESASK